MKAEEDRKDNWLLLAIGGGISYIALWQASVFIILILLAWVSEIVDLPALLFGVAASNTDVIRACMATAAILIGAIITIGNTDLQQRKIIRGLLTSCAYCKKIRIQNDVWQRIEEYIGTRANVDFSHGVCPECFLRESEMLVKDDAKGADDIGMP